MNLRYKVGDTSPPLEATLRDRNGPIDLSGATVRLRMRRVAASNTFLDKAATVVSAAGGEVRYDWAPNDLNRHGQFDLEWFAAWADGTELTVPNDSYARLIVLARLS